MKKVLLILVCALLVFGCTKQEAGNAENEEQTDSVAVKAQQIETDSIQTEEKTDSVALEVQPEEEIEGYGESCFYLTADYIGLYKNYQSGANGALSNDHSYKNTIVEVFPKKEVCLKKQSENPESTKEEKWICLRRIGEKDFYYTREIESNGRENFIDLNAQTLDDAREAAFAYIEGYPNELGLEDGQYYINKLIIHSPQYEWLNPSDFLNVAVKVQNNKIFISNKDFTRIYTNYRFGEMPAIPFYYSENLLQKLPSSGKCLETSGDKSGGGEGYMIFCDNGELKAVCGGHNFAFQEEFTCVFGKEKIEPETVYDMNFPFYGLFETDVKAYTTQDFDKEPDFEIPANTVEFIDYYYKFSEKNEQHLVLLKQMVSTKNGNFYECEYLGQNYWINEKEFPPRSIYLSIKDVRAAVGFENGL